LIHQSDHQDVFVLVLQNDRHGLPSLKSIAQEATNRAGLKVPLSQATTPQTQMPVGPPTAPSISQSGKKKKIPGGSDNFRENCKRFKSFNSG
jgi:hypothetical protein